MPSQSQHRTQREGARRPYRDGLSLNRRTTADARPRRIRIKLKIHANPPAGSAFTTHYITFPVTAPLTTQSMESGFALKLHALLCRRYVKGRDWYDFAWYAARRTRPDLNLLRNALYQQGPWAGATTEIDPRWVAEHMEGTIRRIDWAAARNDVQRFLPRREQDGLRHWGPDFFLQHLARVNKTLIGSE